MYILSERYTSVFTLLENYLKKIAQFFYEQFPKNPDVKGSLPSLMLLVGNRTCEEVEIKRKFLDH